MNLNDLSASGFLKNQRTNVVCHGLLEENSVANIYEHSLLNKNDENDDVTPLDEQNVDRKTLSNKKDKLVKNDQPMPSMTKAHSFNPFIMRNVMS